MMMMYLNELTGVVALALYVLVMFGLGPQSLRQNTRQTALLARAIVLIFTVTALRMGYHDLWRSAVVAFGWADIRALLPRTQVFNGLSNAWFAASLWVALRAMRESIPEGERHEWPWYRAPFYPGGVPIVRRRF